MARVTVESITGQGNEFLTTWDWIPLPFDTEVRDNDADGGGSFAANSGGVVSRSIQKLRAATESDEIFIWGRYIREYSGFSEIQSRYGGACTVDLNTEVVSLLVDPTKYEFDIGAIAPHPEVADLLAIMPAMDPLTWEQCYDQRDTAATAADQARCPDALWPILAQRTGPTWNLFVMDTMPPVACPSQAQWSRLGVPDDRDDGDNIGSWLVVSEYCGGAWRGEMKW